MIKVSIIVPSYNRRDFISETLDSVLAQTFSSWECIIVDDGSIDDTEAILQPYLTDSRIRYEIRPCTMKKGANSCRNYGFKIARGEYIKFLDSDDLLTPDCIAEQLDILDASGHLKVCFSYGRYFNNETKELEEPWSRNTEYPDYLEGHILNEIRWAVSDPLWRKAFFFRPPFDEGLMNSQEWLMHGQALLKLKGKEIFNMKRNFSLIRRGNVRMSSRRSSKYYKNQRKSRAILLLNLMKAKRFKYVYLSNLIKQIIVFSYWQIKSK